MKRFDFIVRMRLVLAFLRELEHNDGVRVNSALYGFITSAMCCVDTALNHIDEFDEDD